MPPPAVAARSIAARVRGSTGKSSPSTSRIAPTEASRCWICQRQSFQAPEASASPQARSTNGGWFSAAIATGHRIGGERGSSEKGSMLTALLLAAPIALAPAKAQAPSQTLLRWFVAPDGDDALDGSEPRRTGQGAAGPFRTLRRAFDEVRATKGVRGLGGVAMIELVPGTHFLDEPLELTPEDLPRPVHVFPADLRSANLDVENPGRPRVVVSGGRPITGFERELRDGRELFVARVP